MGVGSSEFSSSLAAARSLTICLFVEFYFSIVALVDPAPPPQPELTLFPPKTAMIICPIIQSRLTVRALPFAEQGG